MTSCEDIGMNIVPPKDPSFFERFGYQEVTITVDGQTLTVLAKADDAAKACSAVACTSKVACTNSVCSATTCDAKAS